MDWVAARKAATGEKTSWGRKKVGAIVLVAVVCTEGTQAEGAARPALRSGALTACLASAALPETLEEEAGEAATAGIDC